MMMTTKQHWTLVVSRPAPLVTQECVTHLRPLHLPLFHLLARKCSVILNLVRKPSEGHIVKAATLLRPFVVEVKQSRTLIVSEEGNLAKLYLLLIGNFPHINCLHLTYVILETFRFGSYNRISFNADVLSSCWRPPIVLHSSGFIFIQSVMI